MFIVVKRDRHLGSLWGTVKGVEYYVQKIRDLREDADLTQQQVAEELGTSQTMYARYERGANELPLRHLVRLCRLYNVSADYILGTAPCRRTSRTKEK